MYQKRFMKIVVILVIVALVLTVLAPILAGGY